MRMDLTKNQILRSVRPLELAMLAGRKQQSPRTGFVHLFYGSDTSSDTIPVYENGCFALALLAQKKTETVLEARLLLSKLIAFQTKEGNFPIYLHDFPQCYDANLGLKMTPLFLRALRDYSSMLGVECKEKIEVSLRQIFSWTEQRRKERPIGEKWEFCYQVCRAVFENQTQDFLPVDRLPFSASDWWEHWVILQFIETPSCDFYHSGLQMAIKPYLASPSQDRFQPPPELIDWMCSEQVDERLATHRASQIRLAALESVDMLPLNEKIPGWIANIGDFHALLAIKEPTENISVPMHLFWRGCCLHSACLEVESSSIVSTLEGDSLFLKIHLPSTFALQRDALFEICFYVDASPDIEILIKGKKGTCFSLGDCLTIKSSSLQSEISFELLEGEGDFCGHLFRANRSHQKATTGALQYESFDWKIALRTLRRSEQCSIGFRLKL